MVLADMDGNGWIDVVAATYYSPFVSVILNRGYGNWTQFALVTNTSYAFTSRYVQISKKKKLHVVCSFYLTYKVKQKIMLKITEKFLYCR
jgi:hypothetical protein